MQSLLKSTRRSAICAGNARADRRRRARGAARGARIWRSRRSSRSSATCRAICCSVRRSSAAAGIGSHDLARDARATCRRCSSACRSRTRPTKDGRCSTRAALAPRRHASSSAFARRSCRPTTCSTRTGTSSRSTARRSSTLGGRRLGISICEDVWNDRDFWKRRRYHHDPIEELVARRRRRDRQPVGVAVHRRASTAGARRCSAAWRCSHRVPLALREPVRRQRRPRLRRPQLRVQRRRARRSPAAARSTPTSCHLRSSTARRRSRRRTTSGVESEIWRALVLGTRDYAASAASHGRVIGLSGGDRLRADRRHRGRSARRRSRARRPDAVALLEPRQHRRFAGSWRPTSASETLTLPIERCHGGDGRARSPRRSPGPRAT